LRADDWGGFACCPAQGFAAHINVRRQPHAITRYKAPPVKYKLTLYNIAPRLPAGRPALVQAWCFRTCSMGPHPCRSTPGGRSSNAGKCIKNDESLIGCCLRPGGKLVVCSFLAGRGRGVSHRSGPGGWRPSCLRVLPQGVENGWCGVYDGGSMARNRASRGGRVTMGPAGWPLLVCGSCAGLPCRRRNFRPG
jgi:hypothetical protein